MAKAHNGTKCSAPQRQFEMRRVGGGAEQSRSAKDRAAAAPS